MASPGQVGGGHDDEGGRYYSAARPGTNAGTSARSAVSIGVGHQRSSHSLNNGCNRGMTFSANSFVLNFARSLFMLPNCNSNIRCATLSDSATSVSCSTTSSGEPTIT